MGAAVVSLESERMRLDVGRTVEYPGGFRAHAFRGSVRVTDLAGAGKRGKRCGEISLYTYAGPDSKVVDATGIAAEAFLGCPDYATAANVLRCLAVSHELELEERVLRGVDVKPAATSDLVVNGPHVGILVEHDSFSVCDKDDKYNEPAAIDRSGGPRKTSIRKMRALVAARAEELRGMRFYEVLRIMREAGIDYHHYCRMD